MNSHERRFIFRVGNKFLHYWRLGGYKSVIVNHEDRLRIIGRQADDYQNNWLAPDDLDYRFSGHVDTRWFERSNRSVYQIFMNCE